MSRSSIDFRVTHLDARVPDGLHFEWQGLEMSTGPLAFDLDNTVRNSGGVMDYGRGLVSVEFNVQLRSPEFAATFCTLGVDPKLISPVRAILYAEGEILPDHSFTGGLRGWCEVQPLGIFSPGEQIRAEVLPGL